MSISSVNCTPIKPQVSFGQAEDIQDVQKVLNLSRQFNDEFAPKNPEKKNPLQIALSVAGAMFTTFLVGKVAASKAIEFAKATPYKEKIVDYAKKSLEFIKNKKDSVLKSERVARFVENHTEKVMSGNKVSKFAENVFNKLKTVALSSKDKVVNYVGKHGAEHVIKNAAGLATMAVAVPKIATADGNNDGCADIAQKGINAYSSAVRKADLLGDLINAVS